VSTDRAASRERLLLRSPEARSPHGDLPCGSPAARAVAAARAAPLCPESGDGYVRIQGDHHGQSQIGVVLGSAAAEGQA
jgi:hypothetical protein